MPELVSSDHGLCPLDYRLHSRGDQAELALAGMLNWLPVPADQKLTETQREKRNHHVFRDHTQQSGSSAGQSVCKTDDRYAQ